MQSFIPRKAVVHWIQAGLAPVVLGQCTKLVAGLILDFKPVPHANEFSSCRWRNVPKFKL